MPINRVVFNASPLICLSKSGLADLLPALFQEVLVPEAVVKEVMAEGKTDFAGESLISQEWIRRLTDIPIDPRVTAWDLGDGESAVLSFALRNADCYHVTHELFFQI
jgi:predicted nucleic acid-binding protein